jgi:hypothetical protein
LPSSGCWLDLDTHSGQAQHDQRPTQARLASHLAEITASPNQASTEQVTALPPTYLADVLRDEGEAYQHGNVPIDHAFRRDAS